MDASPDESRTVDYYYKPSVRLRLKTTCSADVRVQLLSYCLSHCFVSLAGPALVCCRQLDNPQYTTLGR